MAIFERTKIKTTRSPNKPLLNEQKGLSEDFWGTHIVQYYLGHISVEELQQRANGFAENSQQYAEILTETFFI